MKTAAADALRKLGQQRVFEGQHLNEIVFPLGGVGTGFVGLTGRGGLRDFCCFNRPDYGSTLPLTFPIICARAGSRQPVCRILRGPVAPPYGPTSHINPHSCGEGLPHVDGCSFRGEFPFAWIRFRCRELPVAVVLEAYSPFIACDPDASGYPAAILRYSLRNRTSTPVTTTIAWSLFNPVGGLPHPEHRYHFLGPGQGCNLDEVRTEGELRGLLFTSPGRARDDPSFGSLALASADPGGLVMPYYPPVEAGIPYRGLASFWDSFSETGSFPSVEHGPPREDEFAAGAVGVRTELPPNGMGMVTFMLTWYFPNFEKYWAEPSVSGCCGAADTPRRPRWQNHYAHRFSDAFDVALQVHHREQELHRQTKLFHDALFGSTLPPSVLEVVSSQMAILRSPTVLRLPDGTFYGFEGCFPSQGCCEGSCTHVWNYAQVLPFLFPSLERSQREADYACNMRDEGSMCFRLQLPLGSKPNAFHPCVDGQLGGIIKTFRDWKLCGDDAWLKRLWPSLVRALEHAWVAWDPNRDGVITGMQHTTYDIELYGPNPLSACFYLAALQAAAGMADHLGEPMRAAQYRDLARRGRAWVEEHLFNGEYYIQDCGAHAGSPFQFGSGCLSDALVGQWLAQLSGLGHVLDCGRIRSTLKSILRHNWRRSLRHHACPQYSVICALNDESGLLVCSWPRGGRPAVPLMYHDEVWVGIEYQVASHCIREGLVDEGLAIVEAVCERYDGAKRNPWDQFECCGGHHYARAMSSYGLLLALSGFTFDVGKATIGFDPKMHPEDFATFWSLDGAWGTYRQNRHQATVKLLWGGLRLARLELPRFANHRVRVRVGGSVLEALADGAGSIDLPRPIQLAPGLSVTVSNVSRERARTSTKEARDHGR